MLQLRKSAATAAAPALLPYGRHHIDDADIEAVIRVLRSDFLTTGPVTSRFEAALASLVGASEAISTSSATAALHLAARAFGLGAGDTVIVPAITFVATANAARLAGAEVVFADVDPETGLMGPAELERAIGELPQTGRRALFNVHFAGQCADLAAISTIARRADMKILDDAAHAIGTEFRNAAGNWAKIGGSPYTDVTCFSFHPVKTIAMGEGGALVLNDTDLANRLRRDRNHGVERRSECFSADFSFDPGGETNPWVYELVEPGLNYRASDIAAALGLSQLGKLATFVDERRRLTAIYDQMLGAFFPVIRPLGRTEGVMPAWHLYVALFDFPRIGKTRREVTLELRAHGIGTQVHYIPVHRQPYYEGRYGQIDLPGAEAYYSQCLTLPLFVGMSDDDVARVVDALEAVIAA